MDKYTIGQIFGIIVTILCVITYLMKKREHLLLLACAANLCGGINMLLLEQYSSTAIFAVAVTQVIVSYIHCIRKTEPKKWEIAIFFVLFVVSGFLNYKTALDLMPIAAAVFFMLSLIQKNMTFLRLLSLVNCAIWIVYDLIIGTTAVFAQIISVIAIIAGIIINREKKPGNS